MLKDTIEDLRVKALQSIEKSDVADDLESLRVQFLGKKGELTAVLKQMGSLSAEERPVVGQIANDVRAAVEKAIAEKSKMIDRAALEARLKTEAVDVTIPGAKHEIGKEHPMYQVLDEIKDIFTGMS